MKKPFLEALKNDISHINSNKNRINKRPIPKSMEGSKILSVVDVKEPIPCTSIAFENGWRLDVDRAGEIQCVSPEENPYYSVHKKKHLPIK